MFPRGTNVSMLLSPLPEKNGKAVFQELTLANVWSNIFPQTFSKSFSRLRRVGKLALTDFRFLGSWFFERLAHQAATTTPQRHPKGVSPEAGNWWWTRIRKALPRNAERITGKSFFDVNRWGWEELEKWCEKNISATVSRKKVAKQKTTYKVFPRKSFNLLERETRFELATFSLGS